MLLLSGEVDFVVMYTLPHEPTPFFERAFESITLGADTFIPVCSPSLHETVQLAQIPIISYPSDVFLGQVFDRKIATRLKREIHFITKAETALTLAACEYALRGIGVAWLPRSLASESLSRGALVSLEVQLPVQTLEIRAFRLSEGKSVQSESIWHDILSRIDLPEHLQRLPDPPARGVQSVERAKQR
jgi:DNA-binding transcriptional LysR family regulator